jgi:hypothetical protein
MYILSCRDGGRPEGLKIRVAHINTRSLEGKGFALLRNDLAKSGDTRARAVPEVVTIKNNKSPLNMYMNQ